jgi:hypothetical protein
MVQRVIHDANVLAQRLVSLLALAATVILEKHQ